MAGTLLEDSLDCLSPHTEFSVVDRIQNCEGTIYVISTHLALAAKSVSQALVAENQTNNRKTRAVEGVRGERILLHFASLLKLTNRLSLTRVMPAIIRTSMVSTLILRLSVRKDETWRIPSKSHSNIKTDI